MFIAKVLLKLATIAHKTNKIAFRGSSGWLRGVSLRLSLKAASAAKPECKKGCKCHG